MNPLPPAASGEEGSEAVAKRQKVAPPPPPTTLKTPTANADSLFGESSSDEDDDDATATNANVNANADTTTGKTPTPTTTTTTNIDDLSGDDDSDDDEEDEMEKEKEKEREKEGNGVSTSENVAERVAVGERAARGNNNSFDEEDEDDLPAERFAQPPTSMKGLRACLRCGLIKEFSQFYDIGCENCPMLDMFEDQKKVSLCTSAFFAGSCAIVDPAQSWIAKWLQMTSAKPGLYAVDITGEFDEETKQNLER